MVISRTDIEHHRPSLSQVVRALRVIINTVPYSKGCPFTLPELSDLLEASLDDSSPPITAVGLSLCLLVLEENGLITKIVNREGKLESFHLKFSVQDLGPENQMERVRREKQIPFITHDQAKEYLYSRLLVKYGYTLCPLLNLFVDLCLSKVFTDELCQALVSEGRAEVVVLDGLAYIRLIKIEPPSGRVALYALRS